MRSIDKVKIERVRRVREKKTVNLDYEERLGIIEKTQDIIASHLKELSTKEVPSIKYIEPSLEALNKQLINLITLWSSGFQISNIGEAKAVIPDKVFVKNQLKLPEWMNKPPTQNNKDLIDAIKQNAKVLGEIKKSSGDQQPSSFIPFRRVVKLGNRMVFDDNATSQGGGGGNSSAITNAELRKTPVPVSVSGPITITGDVIVDDVGLENVAGTKINPATEDRQATANSSLGAIASNTENAATSANQVSGAQKTQLVDEDGDVIGSEEIGNQIYLNTAFVQDIEIATTNSSTSNINAGVTFTGSSWTTLGVASVQVSLFADQDCTIEVQQAQEDPGVNWDITDSWTYIASSGGHDAARTIQAVSSSFRVRVTNNGPSATTVFRLLAIVCPYADALPRGLSQLGNLKVSLEEVNDTDISTGNGTADDGTQRVVIASNNSPLPTSATSLPLPTGASTATLQGTANTTLTSIDGKLSGTLTVMGTGAFNPTTPSTMVAFRTTVTTAGTSVQLGSNSCVAGVIEADPDNTDGTYVYVGGSNVSSSVWGAKLLPGQSTGIAISNTNKIYIDASANGNKAGFIGS